MNKEILEYINGIIGKPMKLGETDCNTIGARILGILHNDNVGSWVSEAVIKDPKSIMRSVNAVSVLDEYGYHKTDASPMEGDFIVSPGRFHDEVAYVLNSQEAVACIGTDEWGRKVRKVQIRHPFHIEGDTYRWLQ